jgi:acetate kinase
MNVLAINCGSSSIFGLFAPAGGEGARAVSRLTGGRVEKLGGEQRSEPRRYQSLPRKLADRHRIRRFGFHGISYRAVLERYCALTRTPEPQATIIALHLGSGCSAVAIANGH